jgi:hypothetical protein
MEEGLTSFGGYLTLRNSLEEGEERNRGEDKRNN